MELRTERVGSAVVLHLDGRLTIESGAGWVREAERAAKGFGIGHVLLDLGRVRQLDCAGIGQLLQCRQRIHGARRTLALIDVDRRQRRMLALSGLSRVFRVFADGEEAARALDLGTRTRTVLPQAAPVPMRGLAGGRLAACAGIHAASMGMEWQS